MGGTGGHMGPDGRTDGQTDARDELCKGGRAFDGAWCAGAVCDMLSVAAIGRFRPLATSPLGDKHLVVKQSLLNLQEL